MGLKEVQEELKKQIEEAEKAEQEISETEKETKTEEKQDDSADKKEDKSDDKQEAKEEKDEEKPKKTNADYARERRERIAEQQRLRDELAAAQARIAELEKPKEEVKQDEAPNKDEDPAGYAEWRARQAEKKAEAAVEMAKQAEERFTKEDMKKQADELVKKAQAELVGYEDQFKTSAADYEEVKNYYVNSLAFSIKRLNPRISMEALTLAVNNQLLLEASQLYNEGYENPVAEIYARTKKEYDDFKSRVPQAKEEQEIKPDLERVAKNRERNAGMTGANGSAGKGEMTKKYAATELTAQEWAKLPTAERERLMRQM